MSAETTNLLTLAHQIKDDLTGSTPILTEGESRLSQAIYTYVDENFDSLCNVSNPIRRKRIVMREFEEPDDINNDEKLSEIELDRIDELVLGIFSQVFQY